MSNETPAELVTKVMGIRRVPGLTEVERLKHLSVLLKLAGAGPDALDDAKSALRRVSDRLHQAGQYAFTPGPLPYADITDPQPLNKYAYVRNNPGSPFFTYFHQMPSRPHVACVETIDSATGTMSKFCE